MILTMPPTTPLNPATSAAVDDATSPRQHPKRRHITTPPIECHHRHVATEWKQQEVGTVGKDGQGGRMRGEGGKNNDDLVVVVPWIFC